MEIRKIIKTAVLIVLLLSIFMASGCNLFTTPVRDNPNDPNAVSEDGDSPAAETTFTEEQASTNMAWQVGSSDTDTVNKGVGQLIILDKDYTPISFSVYISSGNIFEQYPSPTPTDVDLNLSLWNKTSNTDIGTYTLNVPSGTSGEITFTISGAPVISSGNEILYSVYIPNSLALDIRGELLYEQSAEYDNGVLWRTSNANDTTITAFSTSVWSASAVAAYDLKFKLTGVEQ